MKESQSHSFFPPDEMTTAAEPSARASSGLGTVEPRRGQSVYHKPRVARHGSESSPSHSRPYLDQAGRLRLAQADRSVSTSALGQRTYYRIPPSQTMNNSSGDARSYTNEDTPEKQTYTGRAHHRYRCYRAQSPEHYHSASSSAASTPPCSPHDQIRPSSASGYRRRVLPVTPIRPSRIISARRDPGNRISASASAVIPLSQFRTNSPSPHLRSSSYASNNNIWRGVSDSAFTSEELRQRPGHHHNNQADSHACYYDSALDDSVDYAPSQPLISPPVTRKLPQVGERLRLRTPTSINRRNTAPGRERPHVEVKDRGSTCKDHGQIEGAQSHTNIGFCEYHSGGMSHGSSTLPHYGYMMDDQLLSDEELETRGNSSVTTGARHTLPGTRHVSSPRKTSGGRNASAEKITVYSNPSLSRFQTSNDEEVDAIFQSESLRAPGRRVLPHVTLRTTQCDRFDPVCNHLDEEVKVPLLSEIQTTPQRYHDVQRLQQRSRGGEGDNINSDFILTDVDHRDDDIINNTNNNNCVKVGKMRQDPDDNAFSVTTQENSSVIACMYGQKDGSTYYQGIGEDNSPTSKDIATFSASKYKRELFKSRNFGSASSRRTASSESKESDDEKIATSLDENPDPAATEPCVVHVNLNTDVASVTESQSHRSSSPKTNSTWC